MAIGQNIQTVEDKIIQNTSKKVHISAKPQTNKTTSIQTRKSSKIQVVKYTTHLPLVMIKKIKRYALDTDKKDYEIVTEALKKFLERKN